MKKFFVLMLFGIACSILFADEIKPSYAIYDFKATFTRLEPRLTSFKADGVNPKHLSYVTVKDTLKGYFVVPDCCNAAENGECPACGFAEFGYDSEKNIDSYLFLYRTSEKQEKDILFKICLTDIEARMFGLGFNSAYINTNAETKVFKKGTKCSLSMTAEVPADIFEKRAFTNLSGNGVAEIDYGFLGFTCLDGYIDFAGDGSCKPIVKVTEDCSVCSTTKTEIKCVRVTKITGSLTGNFNYGNTGICEICDEWSLTDPCSYYESKYSAPVWGSWSVKYNTTKSNLKLNDISEVENALKAYTNKKVLVDTTAH